VTATAAIALALVLAAPAGAATRILAVGDFGVGGSTERATGKAVRTWEADHAASVLLTLGDNDYTESRLASAATGMTPSAGSRPPAFVRAERSGTTTFG